MPEFRGYAYTDAGVAVSGATVNLYDGNTTSPTRATTTTNANGQYTISHGTEGLFDVELTNGSTVRRVKQDDSRQFQELQISVLKVMNPAGTFSMRFSPGAITANRILQLPVITGTDTVAVLGLAQTFTAVQTFNGAVTFGAAVTFSAAATFTAASTILVSSSGLTIRNPGDTFSYTIVAGAITGNRNLNLPVITTTDTLATLGLAQTFTVAKTFNSSILLIRNPGDTFSYTIAGAAITADRVLTLPLTTAADTLVSRVSGGAAFLMCIGDTANANMTNGLTMNQGSNNDEILAFKSSVSAHGVTSLAETDSYADFRMSDTANGGLLVRGFVLGSNPAAELHGIQGTAATAKDITASAAILLRGALISGTGTASLGANTNLVAVKDTTTTRFILDADGDSHQDVGTAWTNFDDQDDLGLLNSLAAHVSRPNDPLRAGFGRWLEQSREPLEALKIVTFNEDGHHFVNMSKLAMLHTGAIRQLGQQVQALEAKLAALPGI